MVYDISYRDPYDERHQIGKKAEFSEETCSEMHRDPEKRNCRPEHKGHDSKKFSHVLLNRMKAHILYLNPVSTHITISSLNRYGKSLYIKALKISVENIPAADLSVMEHRFFR